MPVSYVDVARRPPAPAELRRFSQRHGAGALIDEDGRAYRDAGLAWLTLTEADILARVQADPRLLRLPLVRYGSEVTVGVDEAAWKAWHRSA